jgi:hypothetical protein
MGACVENSGHGFARMRPGDRKNPGGESISPEES